MPGKLTYIVARQKFDSPTLSSVKFGATVAFLLGVQQTSKNKELTPQKRLEKIIEIFGIDIPEWLSKVDVLTRRTFIALSVAAVIRENPELKLKFDEWANYLLANDGLFEGYQDRDNEVKNAVLTHYKDIAFGVFKSPEDAPYHCLVTGVPVTNEWKIGQVDQLHVIKSSAFSYREGRSEEKFKETADAHISPVAFAEFKLRQVMDDIRVGKYGGRKASSIPVSLMSPVHTGFWVSIR